MTLHLSPEHWQRVKDACAGTRVYPARTVITRAQTPISESMLLGEGLIGRFVRTPGSDRSQMVALEVPGDFVDLHGLPLGLLDHDVVAMTEVTVAVFEHEALRMLVAEDADLALALWALTLIDAAIHRHWTFRVGSLRAVARMANFFCEMDTRLGVAEESESFPLPLTQRDLSQVCGLTPVHVNRVLKDLREEGACTLKGGRLHIGNRQRVREIGAFEPSFLFRPDPDARETGE